MRMMLYLLNAGKSEVKDEGESYTNMEKKGNDHDDVMYL